MKRRLLWILTLAMPLLLAWIVVIGELNRVADRSGGVVARMVASRVDETPFSAPMLTLSDDLLQSRPAPSHAGTGEDVYLRFNMKEGRWAFDSARTKKGAPSWSPAVIDVPGRVVIGDSGADLKAEPSVPSRFAISRSTMRLLRQQTLLDITFHSGAFGTMWASEGSEAALPVGHVFAILRAPHGNAVLAVGDETERVANISVYEGGNKSGWLAPIELDQVGPSTKIDGRPLDAIHLESGIAIAVEPLILENRFAIRFGKNQTAYEGRFLGFETDGAFWSVRSDPFPSGSRKKVTKRRLDGTIEHEAFVTEGVTAAYGNTVVTTVGYEVRRYTIDRSKLTLNDTSTIEELTATCMSTPGLIAAAGSQGVFLLTPGNQSPKKILDRDTRFATVSVQCNRDGELLAGMRASERSGNPHAPAPLFFRAADGGWIRLAEYPLPETYPQTTHGSRFLRIGKRIYVGGNGEIAVFDADSGRLLRRITGRRVEEKRRVF
ncbi:MAG TPA: hypothetical protein VGA33_01170 [Thermoanaerobaculia bacterium]